MTGLAYPFSIDVDRFAKGPARSGTLVQYEAVMSSVRGAAGFDTAINYAHRRANSLGCRVRLQIKRSGIGAGAWVVQAITESRLRGDAADGDRS